MTVIDTYYKVNSDTKNGAFVSRTPNGDIWHEYNADTEEVAVPAFGGLSTVNSKVNAPKEPFEVIGPANIDYLDWLAQIRSENHNLQTDSPTPLIEESHQVTSSGIDSTFKVDGILILNAKWFSSTSEFEMMAHPGGTFSYQAVYAWAKALERFITLTKER